MSIGSLGIVGSIATSSLAQAKGSEVDRTQGEVANQQRQTDAVSRADAAAGIGTTQEDSETSDRDADGRRLWEQEAEKPHNEAEQVPTDAPPRAKDPAGIAGNQLDLSG